MLNDLKFTIWALVENTGLAWIMQVLNRDEGVSNNKLRQVIHKCTYDSDVGGLPELLQLENEQHMQYVKYNHHLWAHSTSTVVKTFFASPIQQFYILSNRKRL